MKKTPDDIRLLEEKLAAARAKEAVARKELSSSSRQSSRASRVGLRICADLLSAVIVGAALGYVLDEVLQTRPWCLIVFLLFGGAAGVLNVYRLAQQEEDKN